MAILTCDHNPKTKKIDIEGKGVHEYCDKCYSKIMEKLNKARKRRGAKITVPEVYKDFTGKNLKGKRLKELYVQLIKNRAVFQQVYFSTMKNKDVAMKQLFAALAHFYNDKYGYTVLMDTVANFMQKTFNKDDEDNTKYDAIFLTSLESVSVSKEYVANFIRNLSSTCYDRGVFLYVGAKSSDDYSYLFNETVKKVTVEGGS